MKTEIFKAIPGYEGFYEVSNFGNVKSLPREILMKGKYPFICKEKHLKNRKNKNGYYAVVLYKNKTKKNIDVHQLVAMAFLNHTPCGFDLVIDHVNDNPLDNRVENLQIVTSRYNCYKTQDKYSSKYKGVCWHKKAKKWMAKINIKDKSIYLGLFNCELKAHHTYLQAVNKYINI
jgi:hypothetical protein